ncbi:MAG: sigma-70 family RNA polymerase sigma factor [Sphingomicrobium sp.]
MKTIAPSFFTRKRTAGTGPAPGGSPPGVGQVAEFNRLIVPHLDGAYNLARYLARDGVLAEDVVQDAMVRAFRAFGKYRGGSPRAWLFAIVRNCCRTAQSSAAGRVALVIHESGLSDDAAARMSEQPDPGPTPEEEVMRRADVDRVRSAVEAIPEPFREAIVLRELEDLSYAEIGEVTGVPIGTVMSRLARGRAMLAKQLLQASEADSDQTRSVK